MKPAHVLLSLATVALTACTQADYSIEKALRVKTVDHLKYGDFDPVKIQGKQPKKFAVHGIDLSRHNKAIDWRTVKRVGVDFAFVKATEGKDDRDRRFSEFWRDTRRAGVPRSAYHFYYFCATPEAQAANYIRTVPKSDSALPPILDVEWNPKSPSCKRRPSPSTVVNHLGRWLKIIERHYGQKPIIYTTVDFHAENLANGELPGFQYWLRSGCRAKRTTWRVHSHEWRGVRRRRRAEKCGREPLRAQSVIGAVQCHSFFFSYVL